MNDIRNLELQLYNLGFLSVKNYNEQEDLYELNYVNKAIKKNIIKIYDEVYERSKSYVEPFTS